ncbi:thioesterase family protein [Desulfuromonas thiophila]|uniref:acyl-CoA thioesterase n=1 Tax=Desulfuromonas thiophila TaxID=57664 RepID=UPI0024A94514|nr:acyl-CoA thioesterase [Desulfuromonas thiophila]
MPVHTTQLRVRYAETDAQGIVHHSCYPIWFEEGRSAFLRQLELPYSQWEAQGVLVVVAELHLRFLLPARYEDVLQIETRLVRLKRRLLEFSYRILHADGRVLAEGNSRHLLMDRAGRTIALPEDLLLNLQQRLQQHTGGMS